MKSPNSFHSLAPKKEPISFTFGHTHTGMIETKSPPTPRGKPPTCVFEDEVTGRHGGGRLPGQVRPRAGGRYLVGRPWDRYLLYPAPLGVILGAVTHLCHRGKYWLSYRILIKDNVFVHKLLTIQIFQKNAKNLPVFVIL